MRRRLILGFLVVAIPIVLILPFVFYTNAFVSRLRDNEEKWARLGSPSYEIVVASNSLTDPTGGTSILRVRRGQVVEAENPGCPSCVPGDFSDLMIESLFGRIWEECVRNHPQGLPFPVCNVAYDEELGFPRRLDTYAFNEQGEHLPSITVDTVRLLP